MIAWAAPTRRAATRGGRGTVVLFLLLGAALIADYVHVTPFNVRTHDIGSHLAYIKLVKERRRVPSATDCWECHQPAAYYLLAATALTLARCDLPDENASAKNAGAGARVLQALGAVLGFATLVSWLLTIRLVTTTPYQRVVASALATFWPTLPIEACKVGNDPLVILLMSASLWQLVSWRVTGRALSLVAAAVLAGLAGHAKVNGLVMVAIVLASILAAVVRPSPGDRRRPRGTTTAVAALTTLVGLWFFALFHYKNGTTHPDFRSIGANLYVVNTWRDFFALDLSTFLEDPWVHFNASAARDEFWNYLLRSCLFGEYSTKLPTTRLCAYVLVVLVLAFSTFVVAGFFLCALRALKDDETGHRELLIAALGFLGFLVLLRLIYPYAVHNDFRFIVPVVPPCAVMAALRFGRLRQRLASRWPHWAALPGWLVVVFCVAAIEVLFMWA